uniref:Uncharacterized protein n=1 Tax=Anopheles atroparvus TaxID=41427 RepID=A0AAG5DBS5_ANOAO
MTYEMSVPFRSLSGCSLWLDRLLLGAKEGNFCTKYRHISSLKWPSRRITPITIRTKRPTRTESKSRSFSAMSQPAVCARSSCATSGSRKRVTFLTMSN